MSPLVSIIICTYNRADILSNCLSSLFDYKPSYKVEYIVVDNNSSDNTHSVVEKAGIKPTYILEEKVGLSHARNRGLEESTADWVFYLDDDAMITADFYAELKRCIDAGYAGFTGVFKPYYIGDKPKWLHESFGSKTSFKEEMSELGEDYLCGGVMGFKKAVLKEVGGFPAEYGMAGNKINYGEETFVERQLRKENYPLGINPKLEILHLVNPKKYSLRWNLQSAKAIGKSQKQIALSDSTVENDNLSLFLKHTFIEIPKIILYRKWKQGYSLKYALLKILEPFYILVGRIF